MSTPSFGLAGKNTRAQQVAERQAAAMVTNVSEETIAAIRAIVTRSIAEGIPVYDAARMIRSVVGLTLQQAQAAVNYREELINSGLSPERVNAMLDRYVDKQIARRAETIARTEIMDALNTGSRDAWAEAQQGGDLGPGAKKEWIVTPDENLCPVCEPLDGEQVLLAENFQTANGPMAGPPAHPNCRCTLGAVP